MPQTTKEYYVITPAKRPPANKKKIEMLMGSLKEGESFLVPTNMERLLAKRVGRHRNVQIRSRKMKDGSGYEIFHMGNV